MVRALAFILSEMGSHMQVFRQAFRIKVWAGESGFLNGRSKWDCRGGREQVVQVVRFETWGTPAFRGWKMRRNQQGD